MIDGNAQFIESQKHSDELPVGRWVKKNLEDTLSRLAGSVRKDDSPAAYEGLPCHRDSNDTDVKIRIIFCEL